MSRSRRSRAFPGLTLFLPLFFLIDGGSVPRADAAWQVTNLGVENARAVDLEVAPSQPSRVYLSLVGLSVHRTDDRGSTWIRVSDGLPPDATIEDLAVAPTAADLVLAGNSRVSPIPADLYLTTDGGLSWAPVSAGLDASEVNALLVHSGDPQIAYAALQGGNAPGIYRTTNGGGNWSRITTIPGDPQVWSLAAHPADPDLILAGVADGAARTTDGGATWTAGANPGKRFEEIEWAGDDPYRVYAEVTAYPKQIYRSDDLGVTFAPTNVPSDPDDWVAEIAGHPFDHLTLLAAGSGYGCAPINSSRAYVWKSTDAGGTWTTIFADSDCDVSWPTGIAYDPVAPSHIYVGENGVKRRGFRHSADSGATWTTKLAGLRNFEVAVIRGDHSGGNWARWLNHVLRSTGSVEPWTDLGPNPGGAWSFLSESFEVNLSVPGLLFESGNAIAGDIAFFFLSRSTDGGESWWPDYGYGYPPGLPAQGSLQRIVSNHGSGQTVYAFTGHGLYRSDDGGDTYAPVNPAPPGGTARTVAPTLAIVDPTNDLRLFSAAGAEVFLSGDGGASFVSRSAGLPGSGSIAWLFMRRSDADYLQALRSDGTVYQTTDGGLAWMQRFDLDLAGASIVEATWDPATGHVFAALSSGGVVSSHPNYAPGGLPTEKLETIWFSTAQNTLLLGTSSAGAFHQIVAPPVGAPEIVAAAEGARLSVFPNPSAEVTRVEFVVPEPGADVRVAVHDARGRRVVVVEEGRLAPGRRRVEWDGRGASGRSLPAGVYFVRLELDGKIATSKAVRVR